MGAASFEDFFISLYLICSSRGSYGAKLRVDKSAEFRKILEKKAKILSKAGSAIIRFEFEGAQGLYIAPDTVIVELGASKGENDVKKLLTKLVSTAPPG